VSAFGKALAQVAHQERVAIDWEAFWQGRELGGPAEHKLYLGAGRSCFDDCCGRQLVDHSLWPFPETSLVGPYLAAISEGITEVPALGHPSLLERRPPLYLPGPSEGEDLTYVDLRRAYWAIYTRATLDVSYDGESGPRAGRIAFLDAERLGEYKLARNALVGMLRRTLRRGVDHGRHFAEIVPEDRRRPDLWGLVMDALELLMWTARDLGACYIHTDGAVFAHHDGAEDWIDACAALGFVATMRARGPGRIGGFSRFQIGDTSLGDTSRPGPAVDTMLRAPARRHECLREWLEATKVAA